MTKFNKSQLMKIQEFLIDSHDEIEVSKFHEKTKWNFINNVFSNNEMKDYYAKSIIQVNTQIPDKILNTIKLDQHNFNTMGSCRNFDNNRKIGFRDFSEIIIEAFGENSNFKRNYPSAGGLYSITPIIIILDNDSIENIHKGVYILDYKDFKLYLIKEITDDFIEKFLSTVGGGEIISTLLFAYSIDLSKSIAKYKMRGYRHALIETGSVIQNVRYILNKRNISELCWSGFNDNNLTKLCGMNVRKAPILLIQWWGYSAV